MAKINGATGKFFHGASTAITDATHDTGTVTVTAAAHGHIAKDRVQIAAVGGMTDINGDWTVQSATTNTYTITKTTAQTYTSGGTTRKIQYITGWSMNIIAPVIDVTDSGSSTWREYITMAIKNWDGSLEGFIEGGILRLTRGSSIAIKADCNSANYFSGSAIVTSEVINLNVPGEEAVKFSFTFQGTSTLSETAA